MASFTQHVHMQIEIAGGLHRRHPAFPNQLHRLELELPAELPSLHRTLQLRETPYLGVHETGSSSDIQVLFTDVHMPGEMDGLALAHHARLHWPWIKVLVASGKARPGATELHPGSLFLEKPYTFQHVVDRVSALVR